MYTAGINCCDYSKKGENSVNIYLIRHGETDWNNEGKYQGRRNINLNEKGVNQAHKIGKKLKDYNIDHIYSSTLKRAHTTSEIINTYVNRNITTSEDLVEINVGKWEGMTWDKIKLEYEEFLEQWMKDRVNVPMPKGESYGEVQMRAVKFLKDMVENCTYNNVVVVTHGALLRALICEVLSIDLNTGGNFEVDNCSLSHIVYNREKDKFKVITLNDISHMGNDHDLERISIG